MKAHYTWSMRDVMTEVKAWLEQGDPVAVATVISTWGSAPRPAGSRMAISQSGKIAGSVSGGCLEGEVFEQAQAILKGKPAGVFHYGVSDELAWTVGLSCGGEIDVLIEPLAQVHRDLMTALETEHPVVLKTDVGEVPGGRALLTPADPIVSDLLDRENPVRQDGVFLEPFPRPPELFIFGASHVAIPLTRLASAIGFRVTVVDARSKFADRDRFPDARAFAVPAVIEQMHRGSTPEFLDSFWNPRFPGQIPDDLVLADATKMPNQAAPNAANEIAVLLARCLERQIAFAVRPHRAIVHVGRADPQEGIVDDHELAVHHDSGGCLAVAHAGIKDA